MRIYITLLLLSMACTSCVSQNAVSKSISTKNQSERKVNINLEKDQKLKLEVNEEELNLSVTYPKNNMSEVEELFKAYYQVSDSNKMKWQDFKNQSYITIKKNKVSVKMDKTKISDDHRENLENFTNDLLQKLDWDVDEIGIGDLDRS